MQSANWGLISKGIFFLVDSIQTGLYDGRLLHVQFSRETFK